MSPSEITERLNRVYANETCTLDPVLAWLQALSIGRHDGKSTADRDQGKPGMRSGRQDREPGPAVLNAGEIERAALSLPSGDRERIVEVLLASLHDAPELTKAWNEEILRRLREIEDGKVELINGDQILRQLNNMCG